MVLSTKTLVALVIESVCSRSATGHGRQTVRSASRFFSSVIRTFHLAMRTGATSILPCRLDQNVHALVSMSVTWFYRDWSFANAPVNPGVPDMSLSTLHLHNHPSILIMRDETRYPLSLVMSTHWCICQMSTPLCSRSLDAVQVQECAAPPDHAQGMPFNVQLIDLRAPVTA